MTAPILIDLFAGAAGAGMGYHRAGFHVLAVDIEPHPDNPFPLLVADALEVLDVLNAGESIGWPGTDRSLTATDIAVIHASPPCPRYSTATPAEARDRHPDLIGPVRDALRAWGGTYVIENVPGAPLDHPVMLCGSAFGLRVRRHRLFESPAFLMSPGCMHGRSTAVGVYGAHPDREGGWLRPDGTSRGLKATSIADAQDALGVTWMSSWDDLADCIPPAMTEFIGEQLLTQLEAAA
jgi:DNA (cytosine-5)-methyltransferase 1